MRLPEGSKLSEARKGKRMGNVCHSGQSKKDLKQTEEEGAEARGWKGEGVIETEGSPSRCG